MKTHRLARIAEVIREVASETILYELRDPRIRMTTVTRAEVAADLQHAKVYISVMGTEAQQNLTLRAIQHASGYIQSKLGKRLQTRYLPVLKFVLDPGVKNSLEITRLINEALGQPRPDPDVTAEASTDEARPAEASDGSEISPAAETEEG
jgi:ribosome-binding factor A